MNERPRPDTIVEITKLSNALVKLQETKKIVGETARSIQSIDNSEDLVGKALIAGLAKAEIKRSTSSS